MSSLRIDLEKCIGCGKCARMCMNDHIEIRDKKAVELDNKCLECSHCVSSCPKGAIELIPSESENLFDEIKQDKIFDGRIVSEEDLQSLYSRMRKPGEAIELFVLQGEELKRFMEMVWTIVDQKEADYSITREWSDFRNHNDITRPSPERWESRQVLFIFADSPETAFLASTRMIAQGLNLGIRGYHSNLIMASYKISPSRVSEFFPDATLKLYMSYVIGHPRRMIEPVLKPMKKIKTLFDSW